MVQLTAVDVEQEIAAFVSSVKFADLPDEIVSDAKYRVLDWLGCALAGLAKPQFVIAADMVIAAGGIEQASLLGSRKKIPAAQAALVNGIAGHIVEFDDGHRKAVAHPAAIAIPTALAIAEQLGCSGKEMLTAVVVGYEILIRLGIAVSPSHYRFWHATATCGVFAAAAVAAFLLRLDREKTGQAIAIAGSMASGLQETFGTYAKPLNVGHACSSGIQAALLAVGGFAGPQHVLTGPKGFISATSTDRNTELLEQINKKAFLSNTAFYKMYSSCGHTHSPLDAVLDLVREFAPLPQRIKKVEVQTYRIAVELTSQLKNDSADAAKFSLPYCIACAILFQAITLKEFATDKLADPEILALAQKVSVIESPEATAVFPRRYAKVTIELCDGAILEKTVADSSDDPQYDAIEQKFLALSVPTVDVQTAETIRQIVLNLEESDDICHLMQYLR